MQYDNALGLYRGQDYVINDWIKIHQPTLGEICDYGEQIYFGFIQSITATPTDMKYQLHQNGVDWNKISDYDLFLMTYRAYKPEQTTIVFGEAFSFLDYEYYQNEKNGEVCIRNEQNGSVIDRSIYEIITTYLRKSHGLKKNEERAMTEVTKEVLIEEAKEQHEAAVKKPFKSYLLPLISTMLNFPGFNYNHSTVWGLNVNAFMDAVQKMQKIKNTDLLLQSGYSGFGVDLKKINKKELNYFSEPD